MKKTLVLLSFTLLTGCALFKKPDPVAVTMSFPDAPSQKDLERCPELKRLNAGAKLSDVANTVNDNYSTYYECANKADNWIDWYNAQKKIFESVK